MPRMLRRTHLFLSIAIFQVLFAMAQSNYQFLLEPHDITTFSGKNVLIPCRIGLINKKISVNKPESNRTQPPSAVSTTYERILPHVQWVKDGFAMGTYLDLLEYSTKMIMRGDMKKGAFHLEIISVSEEDSGTYQCQITPFHNFIGAVSREANLTVLVLPGKPEILNGPLIETHENLQINVTCRTKESYPRNSISIYSSNAIFPHQIINITQWERSTSSNKWLYKSITLKADRNLNGSSIICQSKYDLSAFNIKDGLEITSQISLENSKSHTLLNIKFAPYVKLAPTGRHMRAKSLGGNHREDIILEGSKLRLTCLVSSNPKVLEIDWSVNGERLSNYTDTSLMFNPVMRNNHGDMVKCVARNILGQADSTYEIKVIYGPQFLIRPKSTIAINLGDYANYTCLADANPLPSYSWIKIHSPNRIGDKYFENEESSLDGLSTAFEIGDDGNFGLEQPKINSRQEHLLEKNVHSLSSVPYLIFDRVMSNDLGLYRCIVRQESSFLRKYHHHHYQNSQISSTIMADAELILKGRPSIYKVGIVGVSHRENGLISITLKCVVRSAPLVRDIIWTMDGNLLEQQNNQFTLKNTEDVENYWSISRLEMVLNPNFLEQTISYNCTATNELGQDHKPWILHSKDILKISKEHNAVSRRRNLDSAKIITKNELRGNQDFEDFYPTSEGSTPDSWIQNLSLPWVLIGFGLVISIFLVIGATFFVCDYRKRHHRKSNVSAENYSPTFKKDGSKDSGSKKLQSDLVDQNDREKTDFKRSEDNTSYDKELEKKKQSDKQFMDSQIFENNMVEQVSSDSALSSDGSEEMSSNCSMLKIKVPQMPTPECVPQINRMPGVLSSSPAYYNSLSMGSAALPSSCIKNYSPTTMVRSFVKPHFFSLQKPLDPHQMAFSHTSSMLRAPKISNESMEIFYNNHHGSYSNQVPKLSLAYGNGPVQMGDQYSIPRQDQAHFFNQKNEFRYTNGTYSNYTSNPPSVTYDRQ